MTQDREEIRAAFKRFMVPHLEGTQFEDFLIRWRSGNKYWCEHMLSLDVYEKENPGPIKVWRHFIKAEGWRFYAGQEFKFCPECGAKRPE